MLVKISKCKKVICPLCATGNRLIKQIEYYLQKIKTH